MEVSDDAGSSPIDNRLQNILQCLTKCKIEFLKDKEECKKLKELNTKLDTELKEARELEKSHRYHLITSREMIANLQETVSQLINLKRDVKKFKDEIVSKDNIIAALKREKETIIQKHEENIMELRNDHEKYLEDITLENEKTFKQKQLECDTKVAQFTCVIEELKSKIKEMEMESSDKINVVVLDYEEKIQRGAAHVTQLQEQLEQQAARTEANIDAYRRRLEELEEKLKQCDFKQYLAQSVYPSSYENRVERPYSVNRDPYSGNSTLCMDSITESSKPNPATNTQNRPSKLNNLQVIVNKPAKIEKIPDKKGLFNITKKRKLLNMKDFVQF